MSATLDKSLDDIIKSSKPKKVLNKKREAPSKVGKAVGKKPKAASKPKPVVQTENRNVIDVSYATKVMVYGLPRDIKQDAIKVC